MKQLMESDRQEILAYVAQEPEINIFIIGDIENFGVNSPEVGIFVNEINGQWDSLVLRYISDYVVYSPDSSFDAGAVAKFLSERDVGMISGKAETIARLTTYFPQRNLRTMVMTKCTQVLTDYATPEGITIRQLTADDAEILTELMLLIKEFDKSYTDKASTIQKLRTSLSCGTLACGAFNKDGSIISAAQATAGTSQSAMIVGVATHPDIRGRGYGSAVVSAVCRVCFDEGKKFLCLFYDNPQAGRIYNRIGFLPFGDYALFS